MTNLTIIIKKTRNINDQLSGLHEFTISRARSIIVAFYFYYFLEGLMTDK